MYMSVYNKNATNCRGLMSTLIIGLLLIAGCSEPKNTPTLPGAHPVAWMDKNSPDSHGKVSLVNGTDGCFICHSNSGDGGKVGIACYDCHAELTELCVSCHGGIDNSTGAPPLGLRGETADTTLAVGAHTVHIEGDIVSNGIACNNCHINPVTILDVTHLDIIESGAVPDSIAEIVWHGFADGGQRRVWDRTSRTCSNTYCHGKFEGGRENNAPVWTATGQAECGSCHDNGTNPEELGWKHEFHISTARAELRRMPCLSD